MTAWREMIKSFDRIRETLREFYLCGFKSRTEYTRKSARSYDDERRRLESWLGEYMRFRMGPDGKNVFLSIDSRRIPRNPLYAAWKTASFTDGDITLHFILFDILHDPDTALTLEELIQRIDGMLSGFAAPRMFDGSTLRKKLKEYVGEGIILREKRGRSVYYSRPAPAPCLPGDALDFFSETAPCGVIGSFLLDKGAPRTSAFAFKHHYITPAMDSGILFLLLCAIGDRRRVTLRVLYRRSGRMNEKEAVPLRIRVGTQTGRAYLMAYVPRLGRITSYRLDNILSVKTGEVSDRFDALAEELEGMKAHLWGVSTRGGSGQETEHVAFTVRYASGETFIHERLLREKRCGTVERLDGERSRFSADVYDAREMLPWIRTFIGRIISFECSDPAVGETLRRDIGEMAALYAGEEGGAE